MKKRSVLGLMLTAVMSIACHLQAEDKQPPMESRRFNVRDFGAVGDGQHLDTAALQAAIDACAQTGGVIIIGPGTYITGTLFLRSNIELHLDAAATILGASEPEHYAENVHPCGFDEVKEINKCLIYAAKSENIRITGQGTIDGRGGLFPTRRTDGLDVVRPMLFRFFECENITFEGVHLKNAASWCLHFYRCSGVRVHGVNIYNRANVNADGIDLMSTENVQISDCTLLCQDDCICFQNMSHDRAVQNVTISNCIMSTRWAAIRSGGGCRGGIRNVTVSNCIIYDTYGCAIKLQISGYGVMENMAFSNIIMENVSSPISLRFGNHHFNDEKRDPSLPFGVMKGILFNNIRANVLDEASLRKRIADHLPLGQNNIYEGEERQCISICGIPGHPVEDVSFSDVVVAFPGGGTHEDAAGRDFPELEDEYPEYFMWGVLPAYGLYARHVKNLALNNVRFDLAGQDLRPAVFCDDAEDVELAMFRARGNPDARSLVGLRNTRTAFLHGCRALSEVPVFLSVEGYSCCGIVLSNNNLHQAAKPIQLSVGIDPHAVTIK